MERDSVAGTEREVVVDRVVYGGREGRFYVLRVLPVDGGGAFTAAGPSVFQPAEGDTLLLVGRFQEHPKFGEQFLFRSARPRLPNSEDGIRRYLTSGRVAGIGPKLAERLLQHFGTRTLEVLEASPEEVLGVPGFGRARLEELRRALSAGREARETLVYLQGLGLGPALSEQVWDTLGADAIGEVRADPYVLVHRVRGVGFATADRIARSLGIDGASPRRIDAGLRHVLRDAVKSGHTCLALDEVVAKTTELLSIDEEEVKSGIRLAVDRGLLEAFSPTAPPLEVTPRLYLPFLRRAEEEVADLLLCLTRTHRPPPVPWNRHGFEGRVPTEEQRKAVDLLLAAKVSLLTGGPGVGKTSVLRLVVRAYQEAGFHVTLASPTGRAARRLAEATGSDARTLHRVFGIRPGEPATTATTVATDVLVIDEVSMLDLPLLLHVLRRLDPATVVIFVGDPDQLPSVGPGRVLRDLLACGRFPTARLTTVFRQTDGGLIVENAHRILRGELPRAATDGEGPDFFWITRKDPHAGADLIRELVVERIPNRFGISPQGVQVLSFMHRGATGVQALNGVLQDALKGNTPRLEHRSRAFAAGDRVMQIRNDHPRDVMNGDLGVIVELSASPARLLVRFEDRDLPYAGTQIDDLELAFAITVHKSQGSEFPAVVLPLYSEHFLMLRRNVLYTAVTRARRLLVLVGHPDALSMAVNDARTEPRQGALLTHLRGEPFHRVTLTAGS